LHKTLHNEVLKKGYNAETSSLDVLCNTARMIEDASRYNQGMRRWHGTNRVVNAKGPPPQTTEIDCRARMSFGYVLSDSCCTH
jgi:hypothetical protein